MRVSRTSRTPIFRRNRTRKIRKSDIYFNPVNQGSGFYKPKHVFAPVMHWGQLSDWFRDWLDSSTSTHFTSVFPCDERKRTVGLNLRCWSQASRIVTCGCQLSSANSDQWSFAISLKGGQQMEVLTHVYSQGCSCPMDSDCLKKNLRQVRYIRLLYGLPTQRTTTGSSKLHSFLRVRGMVLRRISAIWTWFNPNQFSIPASSNGAPNPWLYHQV